MESGVSRFEKLSTKRLLKLYRMVRDHLLGMTPDDYEYADFMAGYPDEPLEDDWWSWETVDEIKAILDTREHTPNKAERKGQKTQRKETIKRRGARRRT